MAKITFMGAGSSVFAKNVLGDCMVSPILYDSEIALYDIDPKRLEESRVILEAMRKGRNDGLTEEETYLFRDDREKVRMVRKAIEHFDEMNVEGQQGKLDSTSIVYFLKWCAVEKDKEKRLYQYFCDNYKGKYKLLVWSAVSKQRKDQKECGITDRGAADTFRQMMENLSKEVAVV